MNISSTNDPLIRSCYACDLKDDPDLIEAYVSWHKPGAVWPEIIADMEDNGIRFMEIYRTGDRLFMILEAEKPLDYDTRKGKKKSNNKVEQWEDLMSTFQLPLPWAKKGVKWVKMEKIFDLQEQ